MSQMSALKQQQGQKQRKKLPIGSTATLLEGSETEDEHSIYSQVIFSKELAQSSLLSGDMDQRCASQFGVRPRSLFDDNDDPLSGNLLSEQVQTRHRRPNQQRSHQRQGSLPRPPKHLAGSQRKQDSDSQDDEDEYKFLVRHLQKENEQLLIALQRNHNALIQCRQDKRLLEDLLQDQRKLTLDKELEDWIDGSIPTSNEKWSKTDMEALVKELEQRQRRDARHRDDLLFQKRYLLLANGALETCEKESLEMLQQLGMKKMEPPTSPWFKCRACVWAIIAVRRFQSTLPSSPTTMRDQDQKQQLSSSSQLSPPASVMNSGEASVSYSRY